MIADALGPIFLLIVLGFVLNRIKFPGESFWPGAERLAYFVLFPALLIHKLTFADFGSVSIGTVAACIIVVLGLMSAGTFMMRRRLAKDGPAFTSVFQGSIRFNTYIGLACASELYGESGLVLASVVVAILIPLINLLCVLVFSIEGSEHRFRWKTLSLSVIQNPLITACASGVFLNQTGIGLPGWSADVLGILSATALPLGLLAVGVAIDVKAVTGSTREIVTSSVGKFVVLPALMLATGHLLTLDPESRQILLLFACLPTSSSAYILARQLGGDAPLMANIISVHSLLAFIAMPIWVSLASTIIR